MQPTVTLVDMIIKVLTDLTQALNSLSAKSVLAGENFVAWYSIST